LSLPSRDGASVLAWVSSADLRSATIKRYADVAPHSAGEVDDLVSHLVTTRLEVLLPELVELFRQAGQRRFPISFLLVDGAAAVGEERARKTPDHDFGQSVVDRPLDDRRRALHPLLVGDARGLRQALEQLALLRLRRALFAHELGRFFSLDFGDPSPAVRGFGKQFIERCHVRLLAFATYDRQASRRGLDRSQIGRAAGVKV
jgi:hypothetical protein